MKRTMAAWGLGVIFILFMTWLGWGWWGYGVAGDYSLDLSDAFRLHDGQIPYRDFIPTYGALTMLVLAPFFSLGSHSLPMIWLATALLIMIQGGMILWLLKDQADRWLLIAAVLIFTFAVAFKPSNSGFLMGYSTSGFASAFLWTLFLLAMVRAPDGHWLSGFALGLQPFTKIDIGLLACLVLVFILFRNLLNGRWKATLRFLLFFALPSLVILGLLLAMGARLNLLYGSTAEALGQAGYVRDLVLGRRLEGLALLGIWLGIGRLSPSLENRYQKFVPWTPLVFAVLFVVASVADFVRLVFWGSFHELLALNYFWAVVWVFVGADLLAKIVKSRSWMDFLKFFQDGRLLLILLGGVGLFRCALSGWFPLNYYQPALLILFLTILAAPKATAPGLTRLFMAVGVGACAISSFSAMLPGKTVVPFQTPFGEVWLDSKAEPIALYQKLRDDPHLGSLLCAYMPSAYLLTGREPAGLYTYWNRLGFSGKFRQEREKLALELLQRKPPGFVLLEKERAAFSVHFGEDFGREIHSWIMQSYVPIETTMISQGGQRRLLQKKD